MLLRLATALAALWVGVMLALGFVGAPAGFALLPPEAAGRVAGRMFAHEAYTSLAAAVVVIILLRPQARVDAQSGKASIFSTNLLLVMGALFCTLFGYFGLQPLMADAKTGSGVLSFGALHGVSMGFYGVKLLLVATLAWRLTAR